MEDQNQARDLALLELIRAGDVEAKEELVRKYIPLVKHIVSNHYASFLDFEDLMQEGVIGLLSAIDEYESSYNVKFSSFAYICIIRKIYNVIKQSNGNKHKALNDAISLHSYVGKDESRTMIDLLPSKCSTVDPEEWAMEQFASEKITEVLKNHLSILEYTVISLILAGYSNGEIQAKIGVGSKAVDNARTRVRLKLRRLLSQYGSLMSPKVPSKVRKREDLYLPINFNGIAK